MSLSSLPASPLHPLTLLAKELELLGLGASVDVSVSVVDAYRLDADPARVFQRAILRPDPITARPWWWLLWPGERFRTVTTDPELTRILPVEQTEDMARRIRNVLLVHAQ